MNIAEENKENNRLRLLLRNNTKCKSCEGNGFLDTINEDGEEEIQKCDDCGTYATDLEAHKAFIGSILK